AWGCGERAAELRGVERPIRGDGGGARGFRGFDADVVGGELLVLSDAEFAAADAGAVGAVLARSVGDGREQGGQRTADARADSDVPADGDRQLPADGGRDGA